MIPGMYVCAFCGASAFGGQPKSAAGFRSAPATTDLGMPPAAFCNLPLESHMIEQQADGTQRWLQCKACQTEKMRKQRMRRLVEMSPQYQEALLSAHPMEVQTLSLMDVSVNVKERVYGHACGEVRSDSVLLSAPLIARGEMPNLQDRASEQVQQLLATLKETSPLVKQCLTLAEKPVRQHGLALLPPESIADITEAVKARDPEYTGGLEHRAMETVFSLVATADAYPEVPLQPPLSFCVGKVQLRKGTRDIDVVTDSSGLPLRPGVRRGRGRRLWRIGRRGRPGRV